MAGSPILPTRYASAFSASRSDLMNEQVVPLPLVAVTPMMGQGQWSKKYLVTEVSFLRRSGGTEGLRKT